MGFEKFVFLFKGEQNLGAISRDGTSWQGGIHQGAQSGAEGVKEVYKEGQRTPVHGQPPG